MCRAGERLARDRDPDYDDPAGHDLSCPGIGVLTGARIRLAGLFGGGLHQVTTDAWTLHLVTPDWPAERVVLAQPGHDPYSQPDRGGWQVIHTETACELRAVGFSPVLANHFLHYAFDAWMARTFRPSGSNATWTMGWCTAPASSKLTGCWPRSAIGWPRSG